MEGVREITAEQDVRRCHRIVPQLRPHLADLGAFERRVALQRAEGYRIAVVEEGDGVVAFAGFRILNMLHQGRFLYVDDLVTDETNRSRGHGKTLMDWLVKEARRSECEALELDSGVQRVGAHRFYLTYGMHIASYHFRMPLNAAPPRQLWTPPTTTETGRAGRT